MFSITKPIFDRVLAAVLIPDLSMILFNWEPDQSWVTLNFVTMAKIVVLGAIDLANVDVSSMESSKLFPLWSNCFAVTAPWRVELNKSAITILFLAKNIVKVVISQASHIIVSLYSSQS